MLEAVREEYRTELFNIVLPFWDRFGVDHEYGGFLCRLDHDGTLIDDTKFHWFQGRGLWVYSFLYREFGRDPRHLAIARGARDFLLRHNQAWWPERWARDGRVLQSYRGDPFGMFFAAEGLFEYADAAGDQQAFDAAMDLLLRLRSVESRPLGYWMMSILVAARFLQRWSDPRVLAMAGEAMDAIDRLHFNQSTGLAIEKLTEPAYCVFGHAIESYWMLMEEALRRGDESLWQRCAERIRRHLQIGWDEIHGGLAAAIRSGRPDYEWPPETPVETGITLSARGEINYNKYFWAINEVLIATLNIYLRTGEEWSLNYFEKARAAAQRFSLRPRGFPLYLLFTDREFTFQPLQHRQDNYHLPRQLMRNVLTLQRQ